MQSNLFENIKIRINHYKKDDADFFYPKNKGIFGYQSYHSCNKKYKGCTIMCLKSTPFPLLKKEKEKYCLSSVSDFDRSVSDLTLLVLAT